jgi:hypothetical protein
MKQKRDFFQTNPIFSKCLSYNNMQLRGWTLSRLSRRYFPRIPAFSRLARKKLFLAAPETTPAKPPMSRPFRNREADPPTLPVPLLEATVIRWGEHPMAEAQLQSLFSRT